MFSIFLCSYLLFVIFGEVVSSYRYLVFFIYSRCMLLIIYTFCKMFPQWVVCLFIFFISFKEKENLNLKFIVIVCSFMDQDFCIVSMKLYCIVLYL